MPVRGPDHAAYWPDRSDRLEAAKPWANASKRRILAAWALCVLAGLGAAAGWAIESVWTTLAAGEPSSAVLPGGLVLLGMGALAIWTDRMLYKASRPAFALPGEVYDERQAALVAAASRPARALDGLGVVVVAALGVAGAPGGYVAGAALAVLALVLSGPQIVLVWTLSEAEFDFDGEIAAGGGDA